MYRVLEDCFPDEYIHLSGNELKVDYGMISKPDYYIRNKSKIFLFENKDVFIRAEIKHSADFNLLEPEIKKRPYFEIKNDEKGIKNGAVLQLIGNLKVILEGESSADKDIKKQSKYFQY